MPRDVATHWNSTYDMLNFAVDYRKAIEHVTLDLKNDLRKYKLTDIEWQIAVELKDTLKVDMSFACVFQSHSHATFVYTADSQGWHRILFTRHPELSHCHPGYGPY
jgi:hypothetical protein